jgi:peptidoglycan glycosyltransferase
MEKRIRRLGIFMVLCFVALFIQLNNIQVVKSQKLANSPNNPNVLSVARSQPRGQILTSDGVLLASSVATTGNYYTYQRVYNPDTAVLFSQIVGYDSLIYGRTGIEEEYNAYLQSHTRPAKTIRDLLVNRTTTDNVTLTINSHLQSQVAAAVDATDVNGSAPEAGAVVINVKTGAIEAMYGNPTYNPIGLVSPDTKVETATWNALDYKSPLSPLVSRTFQRGFEPGSTFKVVTSAGVYDHKPALANVNIPKTQCITLPQTGGQQLCNYGRNTPQGPENCGGVLTITLPESCDTAFAQLGMALGGPTLTTEANAFGFNQIIPIDIPGSQPSLFPSGPSFNENQAAQAKSAFGQQDVIATALQMGLVASGIADQGVIMTPHVMQQIRDTQGNLVTTYAPKKWLQATSPLTAAAVTSLMQSVVSSPNGTAYGVFPSSWNVAAKTGTAETGTGNAQGNNLTNDWMIAFAPANDPTVAVAVVVPNQPGSSTGAKISGPPTRTILGDALGVTP